jgi:hypothetical protein
LPDDYQLSGFFVAIFDWQLPFSLAPIAVEIPSVQAVQKIVRLNNHLPACTIGLEQEREIHLLTMTVVVLLKMFIFLCIFYFMLRKLGFILWI